ncbi:unnamed protein product [Staurois parvus]|uniref:Secreted protein n=1 Tax=Staurois parvus TaxID=386267 RepID=A0ABN9F1C4_9NEOB|nr:unnamed protein product [Staurois parvus]
MPVIRLVCSRIVLPLPRSPSDTYQPRSVGNGQTQPISWHGPGCKPTEITCPLPCPCTFGCSRHPMRSIACCGLRPTGNSEEELTEGGQGNGGRHPAVFHASHARTS